MLYGDQLKPQIKSEKNKSIKWKKQNKQTHNQISVSYQYNNNNIIKNKCYSQVMLMGFTKPQYNMTDANIWWSDKVIFFPLTFVQNWITCVIYKSLQK